jgi:hypothetical protein
VPLSVHIEELHSDVVPAAPLSDQPPAGRAPDPPWVAEECWRDQHDRAEWLVRRVCAVDFDD